MILIRRRVLLRAFVATALCLVSRGRLGRALTSEPGPDHSLLTTEAPDAAYAALSLQAFLDLSRFVTGKPDLPDAFGRQLLALYRSDPGRLQPLSELHGEIAARNRGEAAPASFDSWMQTAKDTLKLAAMQLLEQWYTGLYRDDPQALVVSYEDALMYRPCAAVHPVPTRCGGKMGFWSKPPEVAPELPMILRERD